MGTVRSVTGASDTATRDRPVNGTASIDLNADVGELSDPTIDLDLLEVISSANVACGGHAGDLTSMTRLCTAAVAHSVAIGAQVSYPDREGFGRRPFTMSTDALSESLHIQFRDLRDAADAAGGRVCYIKPHGALYHAAIDDPMTAAVIVDLAEFHQVPVLTMGFGHVRVRADSVGIPVYREAFLDRGYTDDGRLAPRDQPGALLAADAALERLDVWINHSFHGAHSLCVHSDSPDAIELARRTRELLTLRQIRIEAFTRSTGSTR